MTFSVSISGHAPDPASEKAFADAVLDACRKLRDAGGSAGGSVWTTHHGNFPVAPPTSSQP